MDVGVNFPGLRHKKHKNWQDYFMDSVGPLIIFPTTTHTHVFGNHNNGYIHLKTAEVQSSVDYRKTEPSTV
jgi:hypothetical protein